MIQYSYFFPEFKTDEPLVSDLMITLSSLLVRNEFCTKVEDASGLEIIKDVLITFHENDVSGLLLMHIF